MFMQYILVTFPYPPSFACAPLSVPPSTCQPPHHPPPVVNIPVTRVLNVCGVEETKYKLTSTPPPSIAPLYNCCNRYGCKSNITAPTSSCCSSPSPLTSFSSPQYFHHHPRHDIFCGLNLWHRRHGGHHHLHHHARHLLSLKELSRKQRISKICC